MAPCPVPCRSERTDVYPYHTRYTNTVHTIRATDEILCVINSIYFSTFVLPFDKAGVIVSATTISILCVFGILANALTIATVLTSKKLR